MSEERGSSGERGRWSSWRKTEVVPRALRGEDLDALSRDLGVTAGTIAQLDPAVRHRRSPAPGAPRLQGSLQPRLAHRAPRPPDAGGRPRRVRCRQDRLTTISSAPSRSGVVYGTLRDD